MGNKKGDDLWCVVNLLFAGVRHFDPIKYLDMRYLDGRDKVLQLLKNDGSMTGILRGARTSNIRCNHSIGRNAFFIQATRFIKSFILQYGGMNAVLGISHEVIR